jgi:hypothetical protein
VKGYYQCQHTPGLWRHVWRSITFCLVVDDFGIKCTNKADFEHLKSALEEHYTVAVDYTGSLFCGIKLTWDYPRRTVSCTMPGYIDTALTKYQHTKPAVPQHAPYQVAPIQYGAKVQRVAADTSAPLNKAEIKPSSTTPAPSTPPSSPHSAQSPHARPMVPAPYTMLVTNSWTMWPRTQMQASVITPVT